MSKSKMNKAKSKHITKSQLQNYRVCQIRVALQYREALKGDKIYDWARGYRSGCLKQIRESLRSIRWWTRH
jgi:hypothetical protein